MEMQIVLTSVLFIIGILLIVKGGDIFVDAAAWMAAASGIPKFIIGATIVSVATTMPEMIVSFFAAADANTEMAIGNAVGSVTANTGLIMAISLIFMPLCIKRKDLFLKSLVLILSVFVLWMFCRNGSLSIVESCIVLVLFVAFLIDNLHSAKDSEEVAEKPATDKKTITVNIVKFVIGAVALVVGSRLLVDNGTTLATLLNVPERLIAITLVAIGTSLPELVTAVTALVKKQGALSVGNILGANIIDITVILPVCAFISGGSLPVASTSFAIDLPICLLIVCVALIPTLFRQKFSRVQGVLMLALYLAYIVYSMML